jgi:chitinase domain-containing protein 1
VQVFFPSPRSLYLRLEAADGAGVGVSIWELGQGIERFMEML